VVDPSALAAKVKAVVDAGPQHLQLLLDFDRTITTYWGVDGRKGMSCHGIAEQGRSPELVAKAKAFNDYYYPIEVHPTLTREEKIPYMENWYRDINALLIESNLSRGDIAAAVARSNAQLRGGVREALDFAGAHNVPLIVFSAGIGDVLQEVLAQQYGPLPPSVQIVSNWMVFDDGGRLVGWRAPLIHMFNKNSVHLRSSPAYAELLRRRNVVLCGDGLGDATMAEGLPHDVVVKLGFLNDNAEALRPQFEAAYDVVLLDDSPADVLVDLLHAVATSSGDACEDQDAAEESPRLARAGAATRAIDAQFAASATLARLAADVNAPGTSPTPTPTPTPAATPTPMPTPTPTPMSLAKLRVGRPEPVAEQANMAVAAAQ
jgi:HAD superfamily hydrolase (TIGR01544 family)